MPILTFIGAKCVTCIYPFQPGSGFESKHSCHHPPFTEGETDPQRAKKLLQYLHIHRLLRLDLKLPSDSMVLFSAMTLIRLLSFLTCPSSSLVTGEGPWSTSYGSFIPPYNINQHFPTCSLPTKQPISSGPRLSRKLKHRGRSI